MKTKLSNPLAVISMFLVTISFLTNTVAQEKSKKELKEERALEKQKQIALLVDSKEFIFEATRVLSLDGKIIYLTSNYIAEFHPHFIKCDLPFFGRAYSGVGYGGDGGIKFEGKPTVYSVEKKKKNFLIKADVRGQHDSYSIMLSIYFDGSAYLTINSNNRSYISYDGDIKYFNKK
ncbi:MAG: DUF4251 domain-containing protein [Flavobacterium sp.]|nr:DUF4251 domain-containing protein [Flavobacterium sp.]